MIIDGIDYLIIEAKYSAPKCVLILARLDSPVKKMGLVIIPAWDKNTLSSLDGLISSSALLLASFSDYDKDLVDLLLMPEKTIDELKADKAYKIRAACSLHVLAGFDSNALGAAHSYPNNDRDQVNLSGSILRSTLPNTLPTDFYPFLCMDAKGVWGYKMHTAAQIQQVGADSYNFILAARVKNATLQYQISQATTKEELDLITW